MVLLVRVSSTSIETLGLPAPSGLARPLFLIAKRFKCSLFS